MKKSTATLLVTCPDQRGLVAAIANFVVEHGGNILHADQHKDDDASLFLMRVEWELEGFSIPTEDFAFAFKPVADRFNMKWRLALSETKSRTAILVSKYDHCLADLLYRHKSGELNCEIPIIVSNHAECKEMAETHGIPFRLVPVNATDKSISEREIIDTLKQERIDLVVLARYMQILTPAFVKEFPHRMINIHHSFLPAFLGAKPYHRAHERGVKLIGATSHYVTEVLDDGPIIEQDVIRISHRDQVDDLLQKGRDLEKIVLSRAVRWHLENRILVYGNKTVVFG